MIMLATVKHLVEMKVLRGKFTGPAQLASYMVDEDRREGWLVILDARKPSLKSRYRRLSKTRPERSA